MQYRASSYPSWSRSFWVAPLVVALVAAFFVIWGATAHAQRAADRPDLAILAATFDGRNLHVEYGNNTGVGYPRIRYEVGFQWYDSRGEPLGTRRWINVPGVERGGVTILDSKYRIDLAYRRRDGVYGELLPYFIAQRPDRAVELRITVDDGDRVAEADERNNVAVLKFPPPDLQITDAKFTAANRVQLTWRNANPAPIATPFRIGFTWVDDAGATLAATRWVNVLEPPPGTEAKVDSNRLDVSYLTESRRQAGDRLDWYLERRPARATQLKITMDDAQTVTEANEQNNVMLLRAALPDLVVRDAKFTNGQLVFTHGNNGDGYIRDSASRVLFQWRNAVGQPVGSPRWYRFAQMDPKQMFTVNAERFDVEYAVPGTSRTTTQRLGSYVRAQPQGAERLDITMDDEARILETNETNNTETVTPPPPPQPDLAITDAVLTADEFGFTVRNLGSGATPPGQPTSLWFEWVDATGARVGALAWNDARSAIGPGQLLRFSAGGAYAQFTRFTRERVGGGTELLTLAEFLADIPEAASSLKVHADGPNAIRESNETNNVTRLARPTVSRADLRIVDFTIDPITPRAGDRVWFIVRVENVGSAATGQQTATGITVDLAKREADRKLIGQFTAADIAPGKSFTHRWTKENYYGWVAVAGTHSIEVCADRAKVVSEGDETNNCARKEVTVSALADEKPKLPDLIIVDATLDTAAFRFWYHNRGETATGPIISLWYELVDAQGKRVGELRWINLNAAMQPRSKQQGNQLLDFATLDSERGTMTLGDFVNGAPPSATHLKLTIDGPNAHAEANEQNNSVFLALPAKPMPDLAFARTALIPDAPDPRIDYVLKNAGTADMTGGVLELQWLTADGKPTGPAHAFVTFGLLKPGDTATRGLLMQDSGPKPGQTGRYLLLPPKDATQIRMTLDPTNVIVESDEENNVAVLARPAAVPLSDLTVTAVTFTLDAFALTYQNIGTVRAGLGMPLSTWFEWVDASGSRVGDLVWHDDATLPPKYRTQIEVETEVSSASRSAFPLREFLEKPPDGATHLKVTVDGPNALLEANEANNTTLLPKPVPPMPDLTIVGSQLKAQSLFLGVKNGGRMPSTGLSLWFEWNDASGTRVGDRFEYDLPKHTILAGQTGSYAFGTTIPLDKPVLRRVTATGSVPATTADLLADPPAPATHLKVTVDGPNRIAESNEDNNDAMLDRAKPPKPTTLPDLVVAEFTFEPRVPQVGDIVTFTARVENRGGSRVGQVSVTSLDVDLKNDTTRDVSFAQFVTKDLESGASEAHSWKREYGRGYTWLAVAGTHALLACADAKSVVRESDDENNCVRRVITIGAAEEDTTRAPDLTWRVFLRDKTSYAYSIQVDNTGDAVAPAHAWEMQWVDADQKSVGPPAQYTFNHALSAGKSVGNTVQYRKVTMTIPPYDAYTLAPPLGAVMLRLTVDPHNAIPEKNEANNTIVLDPPPERKETPKPEEAVRPDLVLRDATLADGKLKVTIVNAGKGPAERVMWQFTWLGGKGEALATSEVEAAVGTLKSNASYPVELPYFNARPVGIFRFLQDMPDGAAALAIAVDPKNAIAESDEGNNTTRTALPGADLAIGAATVRGDAFIIPVVNHGTTASVPTDMWLQWYGKGKWLPGSGAVDVPAVGGGATVEVKVPLNRSFGPDGKLLTDIPPTAERLRLFVDGLRKVPERNEQNNLLMVDRSVFPTAAEPEKPGKPDLVPEGLKVGPASPTEGAMLDFSAVVRNKGTGKAAASVAWFIVDFGRDDEPDVSPEPDDVKPLAPNATQPVVWEDAVEAQAGTHAVEFCVDVEEVVDEANEDNNCVSRTFTVGGGATVPSRARVVTSPFRSLLGVILSGFATPIVAGERPY